MKKDFKKRKFNVQDGGKIIIMTNQVTKKDVTFLNGWHVFLMVRADRLKK